MVMGLLMIFQIGLYAQNYDKADSLYLLGNYPMAINAYAKVGDKRAQLQMARAYDAMGNYDKAIAQYASMVENHPKYELARFEFGKLLLRTKKYQAASNLFFELIAMNGGNAEYEYYLARSLQQEGGSGAAIPHFVKAVDKDSTHLRSLFALGKYYVGLQQKDSALKYINKGLRCYENDIALINLKALAYFNDGQYERAIPFFERLLALGENRPFIHQKLGYAYFRSWAFEKAKMHYHKLKRSPEKSAIAYSGLGEVFMKEEKLDSAEHYITKSIEERKVDFSTDYADLGRIARLRGQTKKALDYYERAWKENTDNPAFYYQNCTLFDELTTAPEPKLTRYNNYLTIYGNTMPFISERVNRRVAELKEEIHFNGN